MLCFRYYGGSSLTCLAQSEPLIIKEPEEGVWRVKPRRFVRVKPNLNTLTNGIENSAFQDTESPQLSPKLLEVQDRLANSPKHLEVERLKSPDHVQSGVRRKSPIECTTSENSLVISGTKKKVRPNVNAKSPNKEYYQIWNSENPKPAPASPILAVDDELFEEAPPLPPRLLHRPLERSHAFLIPPVVPRQHKPKKTQQQQQKPEDCFGFELIDVDDPPLTLSSSPRLALVESPSFELERRLKSSKSTKIIGCDNYITAVLPKSVSSPVQCHSSLSNCSSTSSEEQLSGTVEINMKPHKPLSRQLSNASSSKLCVTPTLPIGGELVINQLLEKKLSNESTSSLEAPTLCDLIPDEFMENNNLTGNPLTPSTPLRKPSDFSELTSTSTHKHPKEQSLVRPHPRALARVAGLSNNLPVCPPTPTHHARKSRAKEVLRPPTLKSSFDNPEFEIVTSPEVKHADIRPLDTLDGWAIASPPSNSLNIDEVDGEIAACSSDSSSKVISGHKALTKPSWSLKVSQDARLELKNLGEIHNIIDTRPPDVRSQDLGRPDLPGEVLDNGEASGGGIPIPLKHLTSTRLPSIPERSSRVVVDTENEEPLPTCK